MEVELENPLKAWRKLTNGCLPFQLIGAEESGLWVLAVLCPLVKIWRVTIVDEFLEF